MIAFGLFTSCIVAACASGNDSVFADGGGFPGTTVAHGNGGAGGGMTCVAQCTTDQDCQSTCPPVSGANCCAMGVCYVEPAACPSQTTTGTGVGGSMY